MNYDEHSQRRMIQATLQMERLNRHVPRGFKRRWPGAGTVVSGVGSGTASSLAMLCEDIAGYAWSADSQALVPTVRCLPITRASGNRYVSPDASTFLAEPGGSVALQTADEGCCGSVSEGESGLVIAVPINGNNRIDVGDDTVTVTGTGIDATSEVKLQWNGAGTTLDGTVNSDGTWSFTDISVSALSTGFNYLDVWEVDIDSFVHKKRRAHLQVTDSYTSAQLAVLEDTPTIAPDLLTTSDTGDLDDDNRTADTTPTFRVTAASGTDLANAYPRLYANGVLVYDDYSSPVAAFDGNGQVNITPNTSWTGADGTYRLTMTVWIDEGGAAVESGHSPPIDIIIDSGIVASTGKITATCQATADFDVDDDPIPVDNVVITNRSGGSTPSAPTTVPQPTDPVKGLDNDVLNLIYEDSAWAIDRQERYSRECIVETVDGIQIVKSIWPCRVRNTIQMNILLDRGSA